MSSLRPRHSPATPLAGRVLHAGAAPITEAAPPPPPVDLIDLFSQLAITKLIDATLRWLCFFPARPSQAQRSSCAARGCGSHDLVRSLIATSLARDTITYYIYTTISTMYISLPSPPSLSHRSGPWRDQGATWLFCACTEYVSRKRERRRAEATFTVPYLLFQVRGVG